MAEVWKWVTGYEGLYKVSNKGRVKGIRSGKVLSSKRYNHDGYVQAALRKDGKAREFMVHRLVAKEFIPEPDCDTKTTINHKNGIKDDNRAENLEWMSMSEQMQHAYDKGLKKPRRGCVALTDEEMEEVKRLYKRYKHGRGSVALAEKFGVESTTILRVVNGHFD